MTPAKGIGSASPPLKEVVYLVNSENEHWTWTLCWALTKGLVIQDEQDLLSCPGGAHRVGGEADRQEH